MTAATIAHTRRRIELRRRAGLAAAVGIVGGALAIAFAPAIGGDDGQKRASARTFSAADGSFSISHPAGWTAERGSAAGAKALVTRTDGRGMVVVRERPPVDGTLEQMARDLGPQLKRRFKDFKPVSARIVRLSTGPALSYTFVRERRNLVQGIVVAPDGRRSWTIETVAAGDAPDAAQQLGGIVRSFRK